MLSVLAGTGLQLCMMTLVSLVFACLGFLSPNCEAILTNVLVLYVFLDMVAGYMFLLACTKEQEYYNGRTMS